ncbi:CaiB/BaiF CoA-transferase family protein [Seohaeicola sp. SP36]|uniref:CaiB/BaiF CoA transferase family protein n=1 Tax=unclassified Seohaeicola TaxID=2641111 RepID=UPI00237C3060|nr:MULTISPECIES: CaiB/BaiF CoA-transferase family protein [unclassified Seohaeicola]MDD9707986.1 CaiB/BaiF CoA-transferase family protein [Seohaeicola sp. 4SK31]MDD9736749.1 CaiB/BaiF CoA-transferase family protein [Seohaeicola sp. SP36]
MSTSDGPLSDVRVIEMGHVIAAPMCGALLSDFGADVIKIERPGEGDMLRVLSVRAKDGVGVWWKTLARNKRLLALDWKSDEGHKVLRRLVENAHVLIENFRPGVLERAGLAPEVLHEWNPDLVIVRISGYGQTGPRASWPGFGRAGEAMSGLAHMTGFADDAPMHPGFPAADSTTGLMAAYGAMMALHAVRNGSARGQVVDLAIFEPLLRLIDYHVPTRTGAGLRVDRNGLQAPNSYAPAGVFRAKDGKWVTISAGSAATGRRLLEAAGGAEWAAEPQFLTLDGFAEHMDDIVKQLGAFVAQLGAQEAIDIFREHDAVAAMVYDVDDILADPQIAARGDIVGVEGDDTKVVGPVPKLDKTPGRLRWLGRSELGADSRTVLEELGYDSGQIDGLVEIGTVGEPGH